MDYISTRGQDGPLSFEEALLNGLARDGGLYLPTSWPRFTTAEMQEMKSLSYPELAARIMAPFTTGDPDEGELLQMAQDAYAGFTHPDVAPLTDLKQDNLYVLELFSGPTIAFKDYAMQFLSRAFDRALGKAGKRAVILGATSGDTGSAALEAFKGRDSVDVFILFPEGRVSPVQQKQMTSVLAEGAHALAVKGDFDDCQAIVKAAFNDAKFREEVGLSAINSINWARLMPQIVYYFASAFKVGAPEQSVAFSVPTGNFGNVFAGWVAKQMGLPIEKLIIASNRNDILTRFFESGKMKRDGVTPSLSPSMDIQVSSNFERLLFEMTGRDGALTASMMAEFANDGSFSISNDKLEAALSQFAAYRLDDDGTLAEIAHAQSAYGEVIDPHSAVGLYGARQARKDKIVGDDVPIISLACAHPAKFPDAVEKAVNERPALPPHLADLMTRDERFEVIANDLGAIQKHVLEKRRS